MLSLGRLCGVMPASNADEMSVVPGLLVGLKLNEGASVCWLVGRRYFVAAWWSQVLKFLLFMFYVGKLFVQ